MFWWGTSEFLNSGRSKHHGGLRQFQKFSGRNSRGGFKNSAGEATFREAMLGLGLKIGCGSSRGWSWCQPILTRYTVHTDRHTDGPPNTDSCTMPHKYLWLGLQVGCGGGRGWGGLILSSNLSSHTTHVLLPGGFLNLHPPHSIASCDG